MTSPASGSPPEQRRGSGGRRKRWWQALLHPYELFVAYRILRTRKRRAISVITSVSVTGVILGVWALIVVQGITGGFQDAFRDSILGMYPHMVVLERGGDFEDYRKVVGRIRESPGVTGASPSTYNEMLAAIGDRRAGVAVKGIDLSTARDVSSIEAVLLAGELDALSEQPDIRVDEGTIHVTGLVEGTSWTLAAVPEPSGAGVRVIPVPDVHVEPDFGLALLRLVHLAPDAPPMQLSVPGSEAEPTDAGAPGQVTGALAVEPSAKEAALLAVNGREVGRVRLALEADRSYDVMLLPGEAGGFTAQVMAVAPLPPGFSLPSMEPDPPKPARLRLVNATRRPLDVVLGDEPVPALPSVRPGQASGYAEIAGRLPRIVLGAELRKRISAEIGHVLTLVSPLRGVDNRMLGPFGMAPSSARFEVAGWFRSGFYDYDARLTVVEFRAAQRFLNRGDVVQWIDVRFDDVLRVKERAQDVRRALEPYSLADLLDGVGDLERRLQRLASGDVRGFAMKPPADVVGYLRNVTGAMHLLGRQDLGLGYRERYKLIDWEEMNQNLFSALKLQRVVLTVFFLIIIAVAAFNVVGSQVMMIHEKRSAIAILEAMGAPRRGIMRIFLTQGFLVTGTGTAIGLVLGLAATVGIAAFGYPLDPEVYLISELPVRVDLVWSLWVCALALLFTTATTFYSAIRAARLSPIQGLRQVD